MCSPVSLSNKSEVESDALDELFESLVVVWTRGEATIDETDEGDVTLETELFIAGSVDGLVEHVLDAILRKGEARDELVIASQGCLELQVHTGHNGINPLPVELCKTDAEATKKEVTGMFGIMEIVGIVDDALDVAFVIANLHAGFKDIIHYELRILNISLKWVIL